MILKSQMFLNILNFLSYCHNSQTDLAMQNKIDLSYQEGLRSVTIRKPVSGRKRLWVLQYYLCSSSQQTPPSHHEKLKVRFSGSLSHITLFLHKLFWLWSLITTLVTQTRTRRKLVPISWRYSSDRPDYVVLGRIVKELWNLGLEKSIEFSKFGELFRG